MATLEIHDGQNRVRRVRISRENPAMFGSDPMCDVVLDGPGVQPFHGRIRWKSRRFKADASPEVPWIEVNGVQVKSKSLYQGDEIRVGRCRIFLLSVEDGPDHGEKTVVQGTPVASGPPQPQARPGRPAAVEFHRMEMAPPSVESPEPRPPARGTPEAPLQRTKYRSSPDFEGVDEAISPRPKRESLSRLMRKAGERSAELGATLEPGRKQGPRRGPFGALFTFDDRAPGDERVMTSPMVISLVVTFGLLVVFSVVLWGMIARANAYRQFNVATGDMEAGNFLNAIKGFDQFLAANPGDRRSGKAKVLRALARVRQHTGSVGTSWGNALQAARAMVDEVGQIEDYRDSSVDLAEELRKTAEGLADRAGELADPKGLAEAESAIQLHRRVAGPAGDSLVERSKIPAKLEKARAAIRKSRDRTEALASMDAALKGNRPAEAYSARDRLVRRYPDLAPDKDVASRLALANAQVQKAVSFDSSGRPGETEPHPEPLGPPTSLVLRLEPGRAPSSIKGPFAYALADGFLFAFDAISGAPRWQVAVGLASPFAPQAVAGDPPSVLVVDSRSNELVRFDGRTGALIWRQELKGWAVDPPLILGNQLFQPTIDGRLLQIDLASGALRGTLQLGRKLARTPVADDSVQHLYLLADEDCLFVLGLDPLACVAVEYLGHESGSVACPPARVGRFYVLPENHTIDQGRWRVFVIDEAGTGLRQVQEIPVGGWTLATPASSGPVIWSSSDRGELTAFAVGLYDAKAPFTPIARVAPGPEPEGPAFPRAKTDRDFWLASSRSGRFELDLERGKLNTAWTLGEAGPSLAPPQAFDKVLVLTQQHAEGPGTSLWGVDPASGQVRWRTVVGSPWPTGLVGSSSGDALTTLAADGRTASIGLDTLRTGGFLEQPLPRPGLFRLPASTTQRLEVDGATVIVPEPGASRVLVRVGSGEFRPVELPAPLATTALAVGKNLLIAGADGRVYLIDPKTGVSAADPYVPPFDRSRPIRWRSPVALEGGAVALADSEATIRRIAVDSTGRPRLAVTVEQKLDKPLAADPASTGAAVLIATTDGKIRSLAARDLGPQGSWELEAPRLLGPVMVADHAFVADSAGNVLAFAPDGRRLWSARLRDTIAAGPPALLDQSAWFLGRDGSLQRFSLANGSAMSRTLLDFLPAGGPLAAGPELIVPSGLGTVSILDLKRVESSKERTP
jgi:outer membrane protein assembly factor BamB